MTADDETSPATPAALHPTITTVSRQISALSRQLIALKEAQESAQGEVQSVLRSSLTPSPRPSMMQSAAGKSKGLFAWIGLITATAQVVSFFYPKLEGPLAVLVKGLASLGSAGP